MNVTQKNPKKILWYNFLFLALCGGILLFLWLAPPVRKPVLPDDRHHAEYFAMKRKQAERHCGECHGPGLAEPLPENHPPPNRCLFCHRRERK